MTSFIVLAVFCLFAVCVLLVLWNGAGVYKRLVDRDRNQYDNRTAAGYVTTRVRQSDRAKSVRLEDFEGESALIFQEEIEGNVYETRIYAYDGYIRELFTAAGAECMPGDGEKVIAARELSFCREESLLRIEICMDDGNKQTLFLQLRSGEGYTNAE